MQMYGIGGTEVKGDASEAISEISQNRTLMIEKFTADPPFKPEIVEGLKKVGDVFDHYKPAADVYFEDSDDGLKKEKLSFNSLADFRIKGITSQSNFLKDLTFEKEQFLKMIKHLKSNQSLRAALENENSKQAILNAIYSMVKEIDES